MIYTIGGRGENRKYINEKIRVTPLVSSEYLKHEHFTIRYNSFQMFIIVPCHCLGVVKF